MVTPPITAPATSATTWIPWRVAPTSGFEVDEPHGNVAFIQIDRKRFLVRDAFRFSDQAVEQRLIDRLVSRGKTAQEARAAVDDARTFTPKAENPTDMASVPRYMRWFESSYGAHTLAAIIHDNLIVDEPNAGALGSDTLADRFFREMMQSAGVPCLKRWIMWTAVALRSRWAAGGTRRFSVIAWLLLAIVGIVSTVWGVGAALFDWSSPVDAAVLLVVALLLPFVAAPLWGKQYGAGLVAAIAALWILPAAVFAGLGYLTYVVLERLAGKVGLT